VARQVARADVESWEEQVSATSRDAELAMLLVAEEAIERGVDREVVLQAQGGGSREQPAVEGSSGGVDKGKGVAGKEVREAEEWGFSDGRADLAPEPGAGHPTLPQLYCNRVQRRSQLGPTRMP
jgi:hypothetical protein